MAEQAPDTHLPMLRNNVLAFLSGQNLPVGMHEGATVVERPRYGAALLDFLSTGSGCPENERLVARAHGKLEAMTTLRNAADSRARVLLRKWQRDVLDRAWLTASEESTVAVAADVARVLFHSNAREAALDVLTAVTVAAEELYQVSSETHGV